MKGKKQIIGVVVLVGLVVVWGRHPYVEAIVKQERQSSSRSNAQQTEESAGQATVETEQSAQGRPVHDKTRLLPPGGRNLDSQRTKRAEYQPGEFIVKFKPTLKKFLLVVGWLTQVFSNLDYHRRTVLFNFS